MMLDKEINIKTDPVESIPNKDWFDIILTSAYRRIMIPYLNSGIDAVFMFREKMSVRITLDITEKATMYDVDAKIVKIIKYKSQYDINSSYLCDAYIHSGCRIDCVKIIGELNSTDMKMNYTMNNLLSYPINRN